MAGEDAFEIAAAVSAVSGLAALLILSLVAILGAWRLSRQASDNAVATARAVVAVEDLARRLTASPGPTAGGGDGQVAEVRQQLAGLAEQQRQLQETARQLFETGGLQATTAIPEIDDLEAMVSRLDTTVGQMAASLANLIQLLEQQERR
jgi:hypothetical protein